MTPDAFAARGLLWLLQGVAREYDVTADELLAHDRHRRATAARQELWRRLRARGWSFGEIGVLCGFDQTTVAHGCKVPPRVFPPRAAQVGRKIERTPGVCALCDRACDPDAGPYCPKCRWWRKKCWRNGVAAPVRAGAAE